MFLKITKWQDSVFTKATPMSAANHLAEEVEELQFSLSVGQRQ